MVFFFDRILESRKGIFNLERGVKNDSTELNKHNTKSRSGRQVYTHTYLMSSIGLIRPKTASVRLYTTKPDTMEGKNSLTV